MLALNMRQLKYKTLAAMGVAQSVEDPSFEILCGAFTAMEEALPHLHHQVLTALSSCHTFCHTLVATFQQIKPSGSSYFATLHALREQAEAMEQAVTLTVLAPLQALMQRCAFLRLQLQQRDRLVMDYDLLKLDVSRIPDDAKLERQYKLERAWQAYQTFTRQRMDDIQQLQADEAQIRAEIFEIMKLHIAKFFSQAQKKLWDNLSNATPDLPASPPPSSPPAAATDMPALLLPPASANALISAPLLSPSSPRRYAETSWFPGFVRRSWSITPDKAPTPALPSPPRPKHQSKPLALAPNEWRGIESALWALDEQAHPPTTRFSSATLPRHFQDSDVLAIGAYLDVVSLCQFGMAAKGFYNGILCRPALWHRAVRAGGVPTHLRSRFWLWYFHTRHGRLHSHRTDYQALLQRGAYMVHLSHASVETLPDSDPDARLVHWFSDIDVDVRRTCYKDVRGDATTEFADDAVSDDVAALVEAARVQTTHQHSPRHSDSARVERAMAMEAQMRRLLRAYVVHNPRIGYCQGMNFIIRLLLETPSSDEASVFWTFVELIEGASSLYEPGFHVLQSLFTKLDVLIREQLPELHVHLDHLGVHVSMFAARWFLTLFSSLETFGPSLALRFLDLYCIDRHRVLCGLALVVLDELEPVILDADFETCLRILQSPRSYLPEANECKQTQMLQHALVLSITRTLLSPETRA
ncbi:hypothetical protein SDRG_03535 [Saprolegnia diclina VS20]|uniref:Rab-GAP TBC domain-containing protein n=1 Tax=Saprolegnia diclina (strain VS20) TaxID=1156394 RepID=T0QZ17_SAPDV|nr:hypothetical protein SDRG_03535 [Saprolegnia diclina VS20]EQC39330.1 hypothetical protein SDRG_03535 [Saprolegnia diclina VS20]|eukprot:XP_008607391.1 hypothetical protein SDRG_03535 [Saprolegnia diclina VS20]